MILVDSSIWIDYFNGIATAETNELDRLLGSQLLLVGDLILCEVLQGFAQDSVFERAKGLLTSFSVVELGGQAMAIQAAQYYRALRKSGITVRKTVDLFIATWCLENGYALLHNDRDFKPFVKHFGLRVIM